MGVHTVAAVEASKVLITIEMKKIGNVFCRACGGVGHKATDCATDVKLTWLAGGSAINALIMARCWQKVSRDHPQRAALVGGHSKMPKTIRMAES